MAHHTSWFVSVPKKQSCPFLQLWHVGISICRSEKSWNLPIFTFLVYDYMNMCIRRRARRAWLPYREDCRNTTRAGMHSLFGVMMSFFFSAVFCFASIRSRMAVQVNLAAQVVP